MSDREIAPPPRGRVFCWDSTVGWSDTDAAGVVFFGVYTRWVEHAEAALWKDAGIPMGETFEKHDLWIPRVDFRCRYRRPLRYDEPFAVQMWIAEFDGRTIGYEFDVRRSTPDDSSARGHLKIAAVDRSTFTGRRFPEAVREALEGAGYLVGAAPAMPGGGLAAPGA